MAWRAALVAVAAMALSSGSGCVAFNVGEPVVISHERRIVAATNEYEVVSFRPEAVQTGGYRHATIRLSAEIRTTTHKDITTGRVTLTSQKRMAIGLFPGAAPYFLFPEAPPGAKRVETEGGYDKHYWRGLWGASYVGGHIIPLYPVFMTPYSLFAAPFTPWTVAGEYRAIGDAYGLSAELIARKDPDGGPIAEGTPYAPELRCFTSNELARCGMFPATDSAFNLMKQFGLVGVNKYPEIHIREEEVAKRPPETTVATNLCGMKNFEVELRIPEVGFRQTKATRVFRENAAGGLEDLRFGVEFDLPTDSRAADLVTVEDEGWWDLERQEWRLEREVRRPYRALATFRSSGRTGILSTFDTKEWEEDAWKQVEGRTFELELHLEK